MKAILHLVFRRRLLSLEINWALFLSLAVFWLIAFNNYPLNSGIRNVNVVGKILFLGLFYFFCCKRFDPAYKSFLTLRPSYFEGFIFLIVFFGGLFLYASKPLYGDEIYHASYATRHAQLLIHWLEQERAIEWSWIADIPASRIVWLVHLAIITFLGLIFVGIPRWFSGRPHQFSLLMVLILILSWALLSSPVNLFRSVTGPFYSCQLHQFGLADPHPLLRQLPLLGSTAIIGVTATGYHAAGFFAFCIFLFCIYLKLVSSFGVPRAALGSLCIGTLPIFLHLSLLVEQSIWAALASSTVFSALALSGLNHRLSLIPMLSIILIATLQRAPAFLGMIPVLVWLGLDENARRSIRGQIFTIGPLFLMLAWVIVITGLKGSPAIQYPAKPFWSWFFLINDKIPDLAAVSVIGLLPLAFLGVLWVPPASRILTLATLIFLASATYLYYIPVREVLWGVPRYQGEIFAPLIISAVITFLQASKRLTHPMSLAPLFCLLGVNLWNCWAMDKRTFRPFPETPPPREAIQERIVYPVNDAFALVNQMGFRKNVFFVGIYYGGFVAILQDYSAQEYVKFSEINNRHRPPGGLDISGLDKDPDIRVIVVEPEEDQGVPEKLLELGWIELPRVINSNMPRSLRLLVKSFHSNHLLPKKPSQ